MPHIGGSRPTYRNATTAQAQALAGGGDGDIVHRRHRWRRVSGPGLRCRAFRARLGESLYGCGPHGAAWRSFTSWVIIIGRDFEGEALDEILVRSHPLPMPTTPRGRLAPLTKAC